MRRKIIKLATAQYNTFLSGFERYITILGYSQQGIKVKHTSVAEFLVWLEKEGVKEVKEVQPANIKTYYEHLKYRPSKKQQGVLTLHTVNTHLWNIRVFFAWLQESGHLLTNPMSTLNFKYPKAEKTERTVLTITEIKELYRNTETLQERAILSLGYGCGLRAMELVALNLDDIKPDDGILTVLQGKGNKRRVVPMSGQVQKDIRQYIENERDLYVKDESEKALILNIKGNRMRKYTCRKLLKRLITRTGNRQIIKKEISLHNLRHSIATHLLAQGVALEQVRNFLGHSHLETTEVYTRVSHDQLKQLIQ